MNVCEHPRRTVQKTELETLLSGAQVVTRSKGHKIKYKQFHVNMRNADHLSEGGHTLTQIAQRRCGTSISGSSRPVLGNLF